MSNKRLTAVWEHSIQKGTKLLTLLSLADRADDDGFCWPSLKDTAQRARTSRSYAVDIIREIEADGELYIHKRPGFTHQYLVIVGMNRQEIQKALMHRFGMSLEQAQKGVSDLQTPQKAGGVLTLQDGGVSDLQTGGVNSTGHEPSLTQSKTLIPEKFLCACCGEEFEQITIESYKGKQYQACATCSLLGKLPIGVRRPEIEHKQRIAEALDRGQETQQTITARVIKALRLNLNERRKTDTDLLDFLKEREREGQTVERFSEYWISQDWRGKQGQVPTINQVVQLWYAAFPVEENTLVTAADGSFYV